MHGGGTEGGARVDVVSVVQLGSRSATYGWDESYP